MALIRSVLLLGLAGCPGCKEADEHADSASRRTVKVTTSGPTGASAGELCTVFQNKAFPRLRQSVLTVNAHPGDRIVVDHRFEYVSKYGVGADDDAYWCTPSADDSRALWSVEAGRYPCLRPTSEASAAVVSVVDDSPQGGFAAGYSVTLDVHAAGTLIMTFDPTCLAGLQGAPVDTGSLPLFSYLVAMEGT